MPAKDWRAMATLLSQTPIPYQHIPWHSNWKNYASYASIAILLWLSFFGIKEEQKLTRGEREYVEYHAPIFNKDEIEKNLPSKDIQTIRSELHELSQQKNRPNRISISANLLDKKDEDQTSNKGVFRSQRRFTDKTNGNNKIQIEENIFNPYYFDSSQ